MRIERASQIKPGDAISWRKKSHDAFLSPVSEGSVLERRGKNILVDQFGSTDWLWFDDLTHVNIKEADS